MGGAWRHVHIKSVDLKQLSLCPKIDMEVFSSEKARSERTTLACRSSNVDEGSNDLAMAAHIHRDFSIDALLPASTSRDDEHLPSSESAKGERHRRAYSQREAGGKSRSKKREEYDPELEKLVRERVHDLHVRGQSLQAHERQDLPSNERESSSPAAPAIPPRTSRRGEGADSNHTKNPTSVTSKSRPLPPTPPEASTSAASAKTCACGNSLETSSDVCQQCNSGLVINGDHDYINQDHLDAILEEQEGDTEVETSTVKRKRQESEDGDDFMDEDTADVVLRKAKDRRGKVLAIPHSYDQFV